MKKSIIFLDRDGTINDDPGYINNPDDVILLPYATKGLRALQDKGFEFIIITNQSGIGRGYFDDNSLVAVHQRMKDLLSSEDIHILDIYYCPHTPEEGCLCRKPQPNLIQQACTDYVIDMSSSWMIGDKKADIELGLRCNLHTVQIQGHYPLHPQAHYYARNLHEASSFISINTPK